MTATKKRILDVAQEEFSIYGLAGARIDRIATNARASKERLYAYFGDKTALFHAVLDVNLDELMNLPRRILPGDDLPGFAVDLFDEICRRPELQRMAVWGRLQGDGDRIRARITGSEVWARDIESIRRAQAAGTIARCWEPLDLMTLVFGIAVSWSVAPGVQESAACNAEEIARRRDCVREAVARLCRP